MVLWLMNLRLKALCELNNLHLLGTFHGVDELDGSLQLPFFFLQAKDFEVVLLCWGVFENFSVKLLHHAFL